MIRGADGGNPWDTFLLKNPNGGTTRKRQSTTKICNSHVSQKLEPQMHHPFS